MRIALEGQPKGWPSFKAGKRRIVAAPLSRSTGPADPGGLDESNPTPADQGRNAETEGSRLGSRSRAPDTVRVEAGAVAQHRAGDAEQAVCH